MAKSSYPTNNPAMIHPIPEIPWQNDKIGLLPQQSMTSMAKRYPGISIKADNM